MTSARRQEPIRFTRGRRLYQIAEAYTEGEKGYIGICDGRVIAKSPKRSEVARALICLSRQAVPSGEVTRSGPSRGT